MASHLILDRADPKINELVSGWVDEGVYDVRLQIKQSNADAKTGRYEVQELEDLTGESEAAAEAPAKAAPSKPAVTIQK